MKKRRGEKWPWVLGGLLFVVLVVAAMMQRPVAETSAPPAHFSDASPTGSKGLALVLQQLGYTTRVQGEPLQKMPTDAKVWLIFDPRTSFSTQEGKLLLQWVEAGNTLILCAPSQYGFFTGQRQNFGGGITHLRDALGLQYNISYGQSTKTTEVFPDFVPMRFDPTAPERTGVSKASAVPGEVESSKAPVQLSRGSGTSSTSLCRFNRGKGHIYVLPDAWLFSNHGIAKPANAVLATNLVRLYAPKGAVVWDERQHDDDGRPPEPDSIMARLRKPPFSYAIWQLLLAGLLFWTYVGRRLGLAIPLPDRGPVTRASQFAMAMGGLFQKIGRPRAASRIVGDNFRRRLASRIGLSPADPDQVLGQRAHELSGIPYEVFDRLLLQTRTPAANDAQALRDAQEMEMVLRQLEARE